MLIWHRPIVCCHKAVDNMSQRILFLCYHLQVLVKPICKVLIRPPVGPNFMLQILVRRGHGLLEDSLCYPSRNELLRTFIKKGNNVNVITLFVQTRTPRIHLLSCLQGVNSILEFCERVQGPHFFIHVRG